MKIKHLFSKTLADKWAVAALLLAGQFTMASADTDITIKDVQMSVLNSQATTATVEVYLQSDEAVINPQFDIQLPDFLNYVSGSAQNASDGIMNRKYAINVASTEDGGSQNLRFAVVSTSNAEFNGNSGVLLTFQVQIPSYTRTQSLTGDIKVSNKEMTAAADHSKTFKPEDSTSKVFAMYGAPAANVPQTALEILANEAFSVDFELDNGGANVTSVKAELTLPAGVTLQAFGDDNYTERIPYGVELSASDNIVSLVNATNTSLKETSGKLFSLTFKADESMAKTGEIVVSNIEVTDHEGCVKTLDGSFTIVLDNKTEEMKEALEAANKDNIAAMYADAATAIGAAKTEIDQKFGEYVTSSAYTNKFNQLEKEVADAQAALENVNFDNTDEALAALETAEALVAKQAAALEDLKSTAAYKAQSERLAKLEAEAAEVTYNEADFTIGDVKDIKAQQQTIAEAIEAMKATIENNINADPAVSYAENDNVQAGMDDIESKIAALKAFIGDNKTAVEGDVNLDGVVDVFDIQYVISKLNSDDAQADVNGDGIVDIFDIQTVIKNLTK